MKFDEAFEIVMNSARLPGTEWLSIDGGDLLNRILAEDVTSDIDMPPFNKSLRDGFACRQADLAEELTIIETIPAGSPPKKAVGQKQCAGIMTGAVVPDGADCVIMAEHTESTAKNRIRFVGDGTEDNIRPKGKEARKADVVLRAGCKIGSAHIAVLASSGCVNPLVALRPKVGVIATGSELVEPGKKPSACQIRNSNGFQLAAQAASAGAIVKNYGIAIDTENAIDRTLKQAMAENDVVVLSGGVSEGDYDLVREVLEKNDIEILVERIAADPGRPMIFGCSGETTCFGLPGNPVSAFIMFELLAKPFLFQMMGHDFKPAVASMQLERTITRKNTKKDVWLAMIFTKDGKAAQLEHHGSGNMYALCQADGLLFMPAGTAQIAKGTIVGIRLI